VHNPFEDEEGNDNIFGCCSLRSLLFCVLSQRLLTAILSSDTLPLRIKNASGASRLSADLDLPSLTHSISPFNMLKVSLSQAEASAKCTPNLLPCRINHDGPVNASAEYWAPEDDKGKRIQGIRERTVSHGANK